jgi:hypothetical protein
MRFITGDECGLIKECIPELAVKKDQPSTAKVVVNVVSPDTTAPKDEEGIRLINTQARQSRRRGVVAMTWTQPDDDEQFACLRIDGTVELWQRSHSEEQSFGGYLLVTELKRVFDDPKAVAGGDAPIHPSTHPLGLESFSTEGNDQVQLCACNAAGVGILNPTCQESVVQRFCVYKQKEPTGTGIDGALKQDQQPVALATTFALMLPEIALRWWTRSETVLSTLKLPSKFEDQEFGTRPADSIATTSVANSVGFP